MSTPTNILQQVQTYQESALAYQQNLNCFIAKANTKFKNFQDEVANLGSSVTFSLPPLMTSSTGLVASFQGVNQRALTLTCDQAINVSYPFTAQDRIFNVEKDGDQWMNDFGKAATQELAAAVEANVALNANSSCPVNSIINGQTVPTGALHTESGPYRFFGDGVTAINSYTQLATMIMQYKNPGSVKAGIKVFLPDTIVPSIIGTGLNQFTPNRNNDDAMSWEIGSFGTPPVEYFQSNLLPIQIAGNVGQDASTLTVLSTNSPSGANITTITFSGAGTSDVDAIKSGDLIQFNDDVSGKTNLRFLTRYGHIVSASPVQVRATADAESDGSGHVTISITPALQSTAGGSQNINANVIAGMQVSVLPSHRCGLIVGSDSLYLAMPKLPIQRPYDTANENDPDTGVSMRLTYGSLFGQNQMGLIHDATWGSVAVPEYCMRIAFPVNQ